MIFVYIIILFSFVEPIFAETVFFNHSDENSTATITYTPWNKFLARYLYTDDAGMKTLAYSEINVIDANELTTYFQELQTINLEQFNQQEQKAFWLNIATISLVIRIIQIKRNRAPNIQKKTITVLNQRLSVYDILYAILLPIWHDIRPAFILYRGNSHGPSIAQTAYIGKNIDARIDEELRIFMASKHALNLQLKNSLSLSYIFNEKPIRIFFSYKDSTHNTQVSKKLPLPLWNFLYSYISSPARMLIHHAVMNTSTFINFIPKSSFAWYDFNNTY